MFSKLKKKFSVSRSAVLAVAITAVFLLGLELFWGLSFAENDDTGMGKTAQAGGIWMYASNVIARGLYLLYRVFPAVPWFTVYNVAVVFISVCVILWFFLDKKDGLHLADLPVVGVILVMVAPMVLSITFTTNSLLCGAAATMMLLRGKDGKRRYLVLSLLLLLVSAMVRPSTFVAVLPFYGLTALYLYYRKADWKKLAAVVLVVAAIFLLNGVIEPAYRKSATVVEGKSTEIGRYLSNYMDYPSFTYKENPDLYQSVGWDEALYTMVHSWFFMDERVTVDALQTLINTPLAAGPSTVSGGSDARGFGDFLISAIESLLENRTIFSALLLDALLALLALLTLRKRKAGVMDYLFWLAVIGLMGAELFYLLLKGRLVERALLCAALPALFLLLAMTDGEEKHSVRLAVGAVVCVGLVVFMWNTMFNAVVRHDRVLSNRSAEAVEVYCTEHADALFIYDNALVDDYRLKPAEVLPPVTNQLFWGGTGYQSVGFYKIISQFGYDEFYAQNFFDDNVYLLSRENDLANSNFWKYMLTLDSSATFEVEAQLSGVYVYAFHRSAQ